MPYEPADDEVIDIIKTTLKRWHLERLKLKNISEIRVGATFYLPKSNEEGKITGPPLKLHGYQAAATIKVNSDKQRVQGLPDASIVIDSHFFWADATAKQRIALIDHELEHLERVSRMVKGIEFPADDDQGRPKLKVKNHDWQLGGFRCIAERHLEHAVEVVEAQKFAMAHGQLLFGFAGGEGPGGRVEPGISPPDAKAIKGLIGKPGDSITMSANGNSVTIDDSNRQRIKDNCDAVIHGRKKAGAAA
jgi:hypothetical protein